MRHRRWTEEEKDYLEMSWGETSITAISNKLNRSINSIKKKSEKLGLTRHIHSGEYITFRQLMIALGRGNSNSYTLISWVKERGLPIKYKSSLTMKYKIIFLEDFWKWAKIHKNFIDFSKVEKNILGAEPSWVSEQRKADFLAASFKKTPWTGNEDAFLKSLLLAYKYSYREISMKLKRTEGAIKRRMIDLKIKERPLKADNHNPWSDEEVKKLIALLAQGYKSEIIAEHINRSALAINGKIERLQKEKLL